MSVSAVAVVTATPEPFNHPSWCQRNRCVIADGESAIHLHVIGTVAGVEVAVERIDDYDADYRLRTGKTEVNVFTRSEQGMSAAKVGELVTLLNLAALFLGEVA